MKISRKDLITAAASAIMVQAELDEKFRTDIEKKLSEVYEAGKNETAVLLAPVPQLSDAEIDLLRQNLRNSVS